MGATAITHPGTTPAELLPTGVAVWGYKMLWPWAALSSCHYILHDQNNV